MYRKTKYGRQNYFFEEDNGGNTTGGTSQGNTDANQQQTQQQQQDDIFSKIDRDLLPDDQRELITKLEKSYRDLEGRAKQASTFQSAADSYKAQLDQHQKTLQSMQSQNQQAANLPKSLEQELTDLYIEEGISPEQAARAAKIQAKIQTRSLDRFQQQQDQRYAPVMGAVVDQNASNSFSQVLSEDKLGLDKHPDIQQKLWETTQELSRTGQLVSPQVVKNLSFIFMGEKMASGGLPQVNQNQISSQQNNPPFSASLNGGTRFTFPGAGNHVTLSVQEQSSPLDADTMAAIGATVANWAKKPKAFQNAADPNRMRITRNGV